MRLKFITQMKFILHLLLFIVLMTHSARADELEATKQFNQHIMVTVILFLFWLSTKIPPTK